MAAPSLQCAIDIAPIGPLADPPTVVRLARAAEAAGWDGLSIWDNLGNAFDDVVADPFVTLAAVATATERLRLILSALVLPRRRPQLVAQSVATLDRLSGGRVIVGAALGGDPPEFEAFGEEVDLAVRARRLDESLELVDGFLRGQVVEHEGRYYVARNARVGPVPIQSPRPPIWIGAHRPVALRRAARWDGWIAVGLGEGMTMAMSSDAFAASAMVVRDERERLDREGEPFDVALLGLSPGGDDGRDLVAGYAAAGATWWLESLSPMRGDTDALMERVEAGPPR